MPRYSQTVDHQRVRRICLIDLGLGLMILTIVLAGTYYLINARSFQLAGKLVDRVETNQKVVALTLDDGPLPSKTDAILDVLSRNSVPATFYLIGDEIERNPEQAKKIIKAGHEIGNHSYKHYNMAYVSYSFVKRDIEKNDALVRSLGYSRTMTFRPPYGDKFFFLPLYLSNNNRSTIMWDIAPDDEPEIAGSSDKIVDYTMARVRPGSIILMHPMYDHKNPSLQALPVLIQKLKAQGYTFVTVSQLLDYNQ